MKNITLSIITFFLLLSCSKKDTEGLSKLSLEEIRTFVPYNKLLNASEVVYINDEGQTKKLMVTSNLGEQEKILNGQPYLTDHDWFRFRDSSDSRYEIVITVTAAYQDERTNIKFVNCSLFTAVNNGFFPFIDIMSDGTIGLSTQPVKNVNLNEKNFEEVYENIDFSNFNIFHKIYYSKSIGVVAFTDGAGELWVFDRYQ